jgi:hypothetical protein
MTDPQPLWRAQAEGEREAAFQAFLERTIPYFEKVEAEGDEPWFSTVEERRTLFMKRFSRPAPPMPLKSLAEIRGDHRKWSPVITDSINEMDAA